MLQTTKGEHDDSALERRLGLEDRPDRYVVWVQWRLDDEIVRAETYSLPKTTGDVITTSHGDRPADVLVRTLELLDLRDEIVLVELYRLDGDVVKRSPHVILKQPSVIATALVGGF